MVSCIYTQFQKSIPVLQIRRVTGIETVLMRGRSICFHAEKRKIICLTYPQYLLLSGALPYVRGMEAGGEVQKKMGCTHTP